MERRTTMLCSDWLRVSSVRIMLARLRFSFTLKGLLLQEGQINNKQKKNFMHITINYFYETQFLFVLFFTSGILKRHYKVHSFYMFKE